MKRRRPLELSFDYIDTPERRVLSLAADGVSCVPVLGFDAYRRQWRVAPIHVHEECLEISLCLRGDLEFELGGERYPFRPGTVFVSRPSASKKCCTALYPPSGTFPARQFFTLHFTFSICPSDTSSIA